MAVPLEYTSHNLPSKECTRQARRTLDKLFSSTCSLNSDLRLSSESCIIRAGAGLARRVRRQPA